MDSIDFEVTDELAKTMSKGVTPSSLTKIKRKRNRENSTSSTESFELYNGSRRRSSVRSVLSKIVPNYDDFEF
ncbi:hypothetical protein Ocin01_16861 [Orchesella cincta]|uniref:Uncharacterized protein n=1 Tax=Orchesella cincta TaxID=48709 RepID=A0A1D2MA62_ORCCI|nr:hypothetical protein Ocin01_16861 [Orchesella cincta]